MQLRFCLLTIFLAVGVIHPTTAENFDDLGQNLIRKRWHEVQSPEQNKNFRQLHEMVDVAEDSWFQILQNHRTELDQPSQDVFVAHYQAQNLLRTKPLAFEQWIQAYLHLSNLMLDRPWDGWLVIKNIIDQYSIPICISLFLVLFLHLALWANVLVSASPRWMRMRSPFTLFIGAVALFVSSWISGNILWSLYILVCLAIPYSRNPLLPKLCGILFALFLSLALFKDVFVETQQVGSLNEALNLGRTRIEYSLTALQDLTPIQRAIWSSRNQDISAAKYWLSKSPDGLEKSAVDLELRANDMSVTELTRAFENLAEKYPNDPMIQFNLIQLYTRGQELVKADRIRYQMNADYYRSLSEWSIRMNRTLVGPQNDPMKSPLLDFFRDRFRTKLTELGLLPFVWPKGIFYLIAFLLPWILLCTALLHRRRALGLCTFTGETSPSPMHEVSALYQSALQRKEASAQPFRAQVEQSARAHAQMKAKKSSRWSFMIGGAHELVYEDSIARAFLKTATFYLFFWMALPVATRYKIASQLHISVEPHFEPTRFFWVPFVVAIIFWLGLQWDQYRKAQQ